MINIVSKWSQGWCFGRVSHYSQIGQCEQHAQLRRALVQAAVTHRHMVELALDAPERVLHPGTNTSLAPLNLMIDKCLYRIRSCPAAYANRGL